MIDKGNCIVEVYRQKDEYRAKLLWFDVKNNKPMDQWVDNKNPDPNLKTKKLMRMEVVNHLKYDSTLNEWVGV